MGEVDSGPVIGRRRVVGGALGMIMINGCAPMGAPTPSEVVGSEQATPLSAGPVADPVVDSEAGRQVLQRIETAMGDERRADFLAGFSPSDQSIAASWWDNLTALHVSTFRLRLETLDPAGVARVRIEWAVPGDTGLATHHADFHIVDADQPRLSAPKPAAAPAARPIWWDAPLMVHRGTGVTVIAEAGPTEVEDWRQIAEQAVSRVRAGVPPPLREGWSGAVVVEVPATAESYDRLLGGTPERHRDFAAVAWAEGVSDPRAQRSRAIAVRIIIGPASSGLDRPAREVLLSHELTHVARYDAGSAAPLWLVEGYADQIGYADHPEFRTAALDRLRQTLIERGLPDGLPSDAALTTGSPVELDLAYLHAWHAVGFLAERVGPAGLEQIMLAAADGANVEPRLRGEDPEAVGFVDAWRADLLELVSR